MRGEKGRKGIKAMPGDCWTCTEYDTYNEGNIDRGDVQVRVIPHGETLIKSVGNVEVVCQLSLILVPGEVPLDTMLAVGKDTHAHAELGLQQMLGLTIRISGCPNKRISG